MVLQHSLFDAPPPILGLGYRDDLVTASEERELIARLKQVELTPYRFQGWLCKRQTASFGWRYDFEDVGFGPTEPIPDFVLPVRAAAAAFAGLPVDDLVQVLGRATTRLPASAGTATARCSSVSLGCHWKRPRPCACAAVAPRVVSTGSVCRCHLGPPIISAARRGTARSKASPK